MNSFPLKIEIKWAIQNRFSNGYFVISGVLKFETNKPFIFLLFKKGSAISYRKGIVLEGRFETVKI